MVLGLSFLPGLDLFEIMIFLVEWSPQLIAATIVLFSITQQRFRTCVVCFWPVFISVSVVVTILTSYEHASAAGYDLSKPNLREALETYVSTGKGDLEDIIDSKTYPPLFGSYEINYLIKELFPHTFLHFDGHNNANIPISYNKGNDWFRATLGEPMIYTSGIFKTGKESLWDAQMYKLDYVAQAINLKPGDKVLDIGCGWGTLVEHFTKQYGAEVIGVTLSKEQIKFFDESKRPGLPKGSKSTVLLQDAMTMVENAKIGGQKFDKIVSLEMMEHVGLRRYQEFLANVKHLLKDDGTFYMQVAGLKRDWRYDDLVWGLFMGEHIFPGADASIPIGWVSTQVERAGFEVQRVNNLGNHYSRTLAMWLEEWRLAEKSIVAKYGVEPWRRWEVFLRWSVSIARDGGSTVFMITTTKQNVVPTRVEIQDRLVPIW